MIELDLGTQPINIHPYKNPKRFKDEIEKSIKDFLDFGPYYIKLNPICIIGGPSEE